MCFTLSFYCVFPALFKVRVDLLENTDMCSAASKRGKYRQEIDVGASTTASVSFVIIPMKVGQVTIEVKAAVKGYSLSDAVSKQLRVVVRKTDPD